MMDVLVIGWLYPSYVEFYFFLLKRIVIFICVG